MSELIQLEMTLEEARETDRLIKRHINTTRYLLLDMRDRKGWKALGYESFVEYGKQSLGYEKRYIYELADAGEISIQLGYTQECAIAHSPPPESQLRPLKAVPEDERKAIWEEATRKAEEEGAKLTAKRVEEEVREWKQRHQESQVESNERRKRIRELEAQIDLLNTKVSTEPEKVIVKPDDYDSLKETEKELRRDLAEMKRAQRELVQQQVVAKLKEREDELSEIDRKVKHAETLLAGLQSQIDRYSLRQRELKVHLETIESARVAMALLAANLEGFGEVIDQDHELRQWRALADMLRQGAAAIEFFVGDQRAALSVIRGGNA